MALGPTPRLSDTGNALVALFCHSRSRSHSGSMSQVIVSHQQVKICHISVICPDIKPNNGYRPTFSGTRKPLVPLVLCFKVTVIP